MAREQRILTASRDATYVLAACVETFFFIQTLADGRILRADPEARFWSIGGSSWYGTAPVEWDSVKAIPAVHVRRYKMELDYS
jgi:hypothetical protein